MHSPCDVVLCVVFATCWLWLATFSLIPSSSASKTVQETVLACALAFSLAEQLKIKELMSSDIIRCIHHTHRPHHPHTCFLVSVHPAPIALTPRNPSRSPERLVLAMGFEPPCTHKLTYIFSNFQTYIFPYVLKLSPSASAAAKNCEFCCAPTLCFMGQLSKTLILVCL